MTRDSTGARRRRTLRTRVGTCVTAALRALACERLSPRVLRLRVFVVGFAWFTTDAAHAYVGPGSGLAAVGTLLVVTAVVLLAIVGFVWYPVKHLVGHLKNRWKRRGADSS